MGLLLFSLDWRWWLAFVILSLLLRTPLLAWLCVDALAWRSSSATGEDACTGRISFANSPDGGITLRFLRRPAQLGLRVQPTTPLPLSELDRTVANPIVRSLTTIFMLRCDRDIGHADLVLTVTNTRPWALPRLPWKPTAGPLAEPSCLTLIIPIHSKSSAISLVNLRS
jgi:hypothetical protein